MEQDSPVKTGNDADETETVGDITMVDVNAMPQNQEQEPGKEIKLDEMFADDDLDEDEEFPSTSRTTQSQILPTSSPGPESSADTR